VAIVQFSGDRDGVMDQAPTRISRATPKPLRTLDAQRSRDRAGVPWIFVARPGTYGSSGDHRRRRQPVEFHALDAALDALMQRHRLQRIVILGHSGGATAGAALLTMGRTRVACAVLTSGAYGLLERARLLGQLARAAAPTPRAARSSTTRSTTCRGIARDPARRIVLIGSRDDRNTPFALQERFADAVAKAGHRIEVQTHAAEPPRVPRPHRPHRPAHRLAVRARGGAAVGRQGTRSTRHRRSDTATQRQEQPQQTLETAHA
jgi:pimeloyl-ACP methyl ester carboxylesterase